MNHCRSCEYHVRFSLKKQRINKLPLKCAWQTYIKRTFLFQWMYKIAFYFAYYMVNLLNTLQSTYGIFYMYSQTVLEFRVICSVQNSFLWSVLYKIAFYFAYYMVKLLNTLQSTYGTFYMYSQTCEQGPPAGNKKYWYLLKILVFVVLYMYINGMYFLHYCYITTLNNRGQKTQKPIFFIKMK